MIAYSTGAVLLVLGMGVEHLVLILDLCTKLCSVVCIAECVGRGVSH